ncbi:hypothetical protein YTPLAS18_18110 [Nitrospira sp.]|nr:hypothetical protein YTPLAS18_18110 [Nitrospira sp.]
MSKALHTSYAAPGQSGSVSPTIVGPDRDRKEVAIVAAAATILAITFGMMWMSSQDDSRITPTDASVTRLPTIAPVSTIVATPAEPVAPAQLSPALPTHLRDSRHADVYFDFGRNGLSEEAKAHLTAHASFLNDNSDWGVILQGYTDNRGSSTYNKQLGLKRAEAVRGFLAGLGIPDVSMKVVSLGKDGALCRDDSSECQQLNRRVHLEFIKVGAAHLAPPTAVVETMPNTDANQAETFSAEPAIAEIPTSEVMAVDTTEPVVETPPLADAEAAVETTSNIQSTQTSIAPDFRTDSSHMTNDNPTPAAHASEPDAPISGAFDPASGS